MNIYSDKLKDLAKAYNLTERQIVFLYLCARDDLDRIDAFITVFNCKSRNAASQKVKEFFRDFPGAKVLLSTLKERREEERRDHEITDEEKNKFTTRDGLRDEFIKLALQTEGKDKQKPLESLQKMQGFDKPEDSGQDEKRLYYLPWASNCRACALMREYIRAKKQAES